METDKKVKDGEPFCEETFAKFREHCKQFIPDHLWRENKKEAWDRSQKLKVKAKEILEKNQDGDTILIVSHFVMVNALNQETGEIDPETRLYLKETYIAPNSLTFINV